MFPPVTDMAHAQSHRMISTLEYRGIDTQADLHEPCDGS